MILRRLTVEFNRNELQLRALYRSIDCLGTSPKARRREVEQLIRTGLEQALETLKEGPVEDRR